mmetsp:Transcript_8926/g.21779  ORF Transcript_8926/g.21779 Transcript_8926/m.21779 type:complete len:367 (-) Transcript_8926:294-1394(-)
MSTGYYNNTRTPRSDVEDEDGEGTAWDADASWSAVDEDYNDQGWNNYFGDSYVSPKHGPNNCAGNNGTSKNLNWTKSKNGTWTKKKTTASGSAGAPGPKMKAMKKPVKKTGQKNKKAAGSTSSSKQPKKAAPPKMQKAQAPQAKMMVKMKAAPKKAPMGNKKKAARMSKMKKPMKKMSVMKKMKKKKDKFKRRTTKKWLVYQGRRLRTTGGLTKEGLKRNKRGKIVSRKAAAATMRKPQTKTVLNWAGCLKAARQLLGLVGFVPCGGKTEAGQRLYRETRRLYDSGKGGNANVGATSPFGIGNGYGAGGKIAGSSTAAGSMPRTPPPTAASSAAGSPLYLGGSMRTGGVSMLNPNILEEEQYTRGF